MMSVSTSLVTVLYTSELLGAILLELDLRDLLLAQIVSRRWRDAITKSPTIQQKLFLAPISNKDEESYFNPLLQEVFPFFFHLVSPEASRDNYLNEECIKDYPWFNDSVHLKTILREDASWRRMLPVQPPALIDRVMWDFTCYCCGGISSDEVDLDNLQDRQVTGAPMGLIYDIVVQMLDGDSHTIFLIEWDMFLSTPETQPNTDQNAELALKRYEAEEERRLAFRPQNKIIIYQTTSYCYHGDKKPTGLMVRDMQDIIQV